MFTVFTLGGGGFLLSPSVRTPRLLVIIAVQPLVLVFGIQFVGLFEHPAISVSVIGWFVGAAVNLARVVEYAVHTGLSWIASFERFFPLTGFRPTKSGIDCCVFGVIGVVAALVSATTWPAVAIFGI